MVLARSRVLFSAKDMNSCSQNASRFIEHIYFAKARLQCTSVGMLTKVPQLLELATPLILQTNGRDGVCSISAGVSAGAFPSASQHKVCR